MPQLRKDPILERWVVVNQEYIYTPDDFKIQPLEWKGKDNCPFCYGNEHMTPPEIEAFSEQPRHINTSGWQVRVVPNKFPALRIEGNLDRKGIGIYDMSNGIGAHEVIIENPDHFKGIADLEVKEIEYILYAYRSRSLDLRNDHRFKYIMVFKNFGADAGASLEHGHSQLIALPMIPKNVREEVKGAHNYYQFKERCVFCDMIEAEKDYEKRMVEENDHFIAFCPFASRFSFEVWILPKQHSADFTVINGSEITSLAMILKKVIGNMNKVLGEHPYNYLIHTSPVNTDFPLGYHWHIELMPKLMPIAGFEWGSGFYVVEVPPEQAAAYLRGEG